MISHLNWVCIFCFLQDIERNRRKQENPDLMDEDDTDPVPCITVAHFEESMRFARRSVSDADIRKYQAFAQTLQQVGGCGGLRLVLSAMPAGGEGSAGFERKCTRPSAWRRQPKVQPDGSGLGLDLR